MDRYPGAIWKGDGKSGGTWLDVPRRLVLHTTESSGIPGYQAGATAPHMTYDPDQRLFVQHTEINQAARALRNESGGVQTNRQGAIQLEVVAYSNRAIADQRPDRMWVGDLLDVHLDDLAEFTEWCIAEHGVKAEWPGRQALSYGAANTPGFRLSGSEWEKFGGICGHQHVPENDHWDPGAFPWVRYMEKIMALTPEQTEAVDWLVELKATLEGFEWTTGSNSAKRLEYANRLRNGLAARTGVGGDNGAAIADALALLSDVVGNGGTGVVLGETYTVTLGELP